MPITMSQRRREMMLKICDDHPDVPMLLFHMQKMRRCDEMLEWLIKNNLRGNNLIAWFKNVHACSFLSALGFLNSRVEREKKVRPLLVGEDYLVRS